MALSAHRTSSLQSGFTLIELAIVLVIIGLIIGGVLVGQNLIAAAAVRAQISQIEKYQTATNTFREKFGYLPGDINQPAAALFGFAARGGQEPGQGDGNGVIEGIQCGACTSASGGIIFAGETEMFWVDLSKTGLIDGSFSIDNISTVPNIVTSTQVAQYFPAAKIGQGNYVYVWSGGWNDLINNDKSDGNNYFGLSAIIGKQTGWQGQASNTTLTVQQAYNMDTKIDDGLPQSGRVMAVYAGWNAFWAAGGSSDSTGQKNTGDENQLTGGPLVSAGDIGKGSAGGPPYATPNTCYDGSQGLPEQYSISVNAGSGANCALSFRFQ